MVLIGYLGLSETVWSAGNDEPEKIKIGGPGFEDGPSAGIWTEFSTNFGTPICDVTSCGNDGGTGPRSGTFWLWIGRFDGVETAFVEQNVTIPVATSAELSFWLEIPAADPSGRDTFLVSLDGVVLFFTDNYDANAGMIGYRQHTLDISAFADGSAHSLRFYGESTPSGTGVTNFFVDDVSGTFMRPLPALDPLAIALLLVALGATAYWRLRGSASAA
jgi:hypothetical protein